MHAFGCWAGAQSDSGERMRSPGKCKVHSVLEVPFSQTTGGRPDRQALVRGALTVTWACGSPPCPRHAQPSRDSQVEPFLVLGKLGGKPSVGKAVSAEPRRQPTGVPPPAALPPLSTRSPLQAP